MTAVFQLGLLNPNTDERHTAAMRAVALDALPEGSKVTAVTAPRGPKAIESEVDSVLAAAEVIRMLESLPEMNAYLIACFGDPGLDAARELTSTPVVGIGEAAYQAAGLVSKKFAVVTTLPRGVAALEDAVALRGLASRCVGVVPLNIPVSDQGTGNADTTAAIIAIGQRLVDDGAEALVLACGGMARSPPPCRTRSASRSATVSPSAPSWPSHSGGRDCERAAAARTRARSRWTTSTCLPRSPRRDTDAVRGNLPHLRRS